MYKLFNSLRSCSIQKLQLLLTLSMILLKANADSFSFATTEPSQTIGISKGSPQVSFGLYFPNAFEITLTNLAKPENEFCQVLPSTVTSELKWESQADFGSFSYENIVSYGGYFFLLDTKTFRILALNDVTNPNKNIIIESLHSNTLREDGEFYDPFFVLDEQGGIVFIITEKILLSYDLKNFIKAANLQNPRTPKVENKYDKYEGFQSISQVKHYQDHLYIVADNSVSMWLTVANGDVAQTKAKFNAGFLKANTLAAVDIAFYKSKAFVLDSLEGVYAVSIEGAMQNNFRNEGLLQDVPKGQFIEVIDNSLFVVTSTKKSTKIYEYIIQTPPYERMSFYLNRVNDLTQAVSEVRTDGNYLFLITGFYNMVIRPSIPGTFASSFVNSYLLNYWSIFDAQGIYIGKKDNESQLLAVYQGSLALYTFDASNPSIKCDVETVPEGDYTFQLKITQNKCPQKTTEDIHVVCITKQNIRIVVAAGEALGDVARTNGITVGVAVGLVLLTFLLILFCYLMRKYNRQYRVLESQFKFQKLKDAEGQEQGNGQEGEVEKEEKSSNKEASADQSR